MPRVEATRTTAIGICALMALGLALRLRQLDTLGFWYDEMALWLYTVSGVPPTPVEPPLMSWILWAVMSVTRSTGAFVIHIVPVVLGVLAIPLAYLCASRLDGRRTTGAIAATLTAISPMAIYYSREGRPYALFILFSTLLYLTLLWAYRKDTRASWGAYGCGLVLCGLTHMLTVQILIVAAAFSIAVIVKPALLGDSRGSMVPRVLRWAGVTTVGVIVGHGWMLYRFLGAFGSAVAMSRADGGVYAYGLVSYLRTVVVNLGPGPVRAIFGPPSYSDALAVLFALLFGAGLWRLYAAGQRYVAVFAVVLFAVPLSILYLTLGATAALWDWARYISHLLLPFVIVCSVGLQAALSALKGAPAARAVACSLFVLAVLPNTLTLPQRQEYQQYRDIAAFLEHNHQRLAGVIVLPARRDIGDADERIMNIYYQMKREALPVYALSDGVVRHTTLVHDRVAAFLRSGGAVEAALPSGRYAVLWRTPLTDCRQMYGLVRTMSIDMVQTSADRVAGLTVCDVNFAGRHDGIALASESR